MANFPYVGSENETSLLALHLCQCGFDLGEPEGHVHGTVEVDGGAQGSAGRRSSAGMCLSDMFGKMDPELIHQRCQANTMAFGKFDQCRHAVGMQFFSPISQPSQFFIFSVGDCLIFAFVSETGNAFA